MNNDHKHTNASVVAEARPMPVRMMGETERSPERIAVPTWHPTKSGKLSVSFIEAAVKRFVNLAATKATVANIEFSNGVDENGLSFTTVVIKRIKYNDYLIIILRSALDSNRKDSVLYQLSTDGDANYYRSFNPYTATGWMQFYKQLKRAIDKQSK